MLFMFIILTPSPNINLIDKQALQFIKESCPKQEG